jgi:hypothetical protein
MTLWSVVYIGKARNGQTDTPCMSSLPSVMVHHSTVSITAYKISTFRVLTVQRFVTYVLRFISATVASVSLKYKHDIVNTSSTSCYVGHNVMMAAARTNQIEATLDEFWWRQLDALAHDSVQWQGLLLPCWTVGFRYWTLCRYVK